MRRATIYVSPKRLQGFTYCTLLSLVGLSPFRVLRSSDSCTLPSLKSLVCSPVAGWFVAHRHWVRNSTLVPVVVALTLLFACGIVALNIAFSESDKVTVVLFSDVKECTTVQAVYLASVLIIGELTTRLTEISKLFAFW